MPIGKEIIEKIREEEAKIEEFLKERSGDKDPYYSSKEIAENKELNLNYMKVVDVEKFLYNRLISSHFYVGKRCRGKIYYARVNIYE